LECGTQTPRRGEPVARVVGKIIPTMVLLLDRFQPDVLLIPKIGKGQTRRSAHVAVALEALTAEAWRRDMPVHAFSDEDVRKAFRDTEGRPAKNKAAIDRLLVERFPLLKKYLPKERRRWDPEPY